MRIKANTIQLSNTVQIQAISNTIVLTGNGIVVPNSSVLTAGTIRFANRKYQYANGTDYTDLSNTSINVSVLQPKVNLFLSNVISSNINIATGNVLRLNLAQTNYFRINVTNTHTAVLDIIPDPENRHGKIDVLLNFRRANVVSNTDGWNITTATYFSNSFSILNTIDLDPRGLYFKPDGTKMFFAGNDFNAVRAFDLSTPWNINTAVYYSNSFSVASQLTLVHSIYFKSDGTRMFVGSTDTIYEYDLSTPWNINTAVYYSNNYVLNPRAPSSLYFKSDGTQFFIGDEINDRVYSYTLSTPWNINTASLNATAFFSLTSQEMDTRGLFFKPDGTRMFVVGYQTDTVYQYDLSDPWNVNSAVYYGYSRSVAANFTTPQGLFFRDDGNKMFIVGVHPTGAAFRAYDLYAANNYIQYSSNIQLPFASNTVNINITTTQINIYAQFINAGDGKLTLVANG
jgi:hypothetical protein